MSGAVTSGPRRRMKFAEPTSSEEAYQRRQALILDIKGIDEQLGDRCRGRQPGVRMPPQEYFEWRKRALAAKRIKEEELAFLKEWLRQYHQQSRDTSQKANAEKLRQRAEQANVDPDDPASLIHAAHRLLSSLNDQVEFSDEERSLIAAMRHYLKRC